MHTDLTTGKVKQFNSVEFDLSLVQYLLEERPFIQTSTVQHVPEGSKGENLSKEEVETFSYQSSYVELPWPDTNYKDLLNITSNRFYLVLEPQEEQRKAYPTESRFGGPMPNKMPADVCCQIR